MDRYDADTAPDPDAWLALDEQERRARVIASHPGPDRLHPKGLDARVHATLHAVVETQAATGEPAVTRRTIERLAASGLRRHAVVHMVAEVLLQEITRPPFDGERYAARLSGLDAGTWLGDRMRRDLRPTDE